QAYLLPDWDSAEGSVKSPTGKELSTEERRAILEKTSALQPLLKWSYVDPQMNVEQPLLLSTAQVAAATVAGSVLTFNKFERSQPYEFQTNGNITVAMGQ